MQITAAIPCYNGAAFIGRTIQALLDQSRPPDQFLVIDDGSSDESAAIIASYPVELVQHDRNQGLSAARNTALERCRGEVLVYVDADAFADRQMLAVMETEFAGSGPDGVGGQGIEAVQKTVYDRWRALHASQGHGTQRLEGVQHLFGLCMGYRSEVLRSLGGFSSLFRTNAEDLDLGLRLNQAGRRLVYTPQARVYHQRQDDHASLRRMMHQWYYWAFLARQKNGYNPWRLAAGTLRRLLLVEPWSDLFQQHSPALARLDVELAFVKLRALRTAARAGCA